MIAFCADLDNTIIYSYKRDIGENKINVELYQDRNIAFITIRTYEMLKKLKREILFVPISTRSLEQYSRIDLGIGVIEYALVCNGGILLKNGHKDEEWYQESRRKIADSVGELIKARALLETDSRRKFDLRFIEELFIFTKCDFPEAVVQSLKERLDTGLVDVFQNGEKVYVVPCNLSKGMSIDRFRRYLRVEKVIAAGDSEFDISMLKKADIGIAPSGFKKKFQVDFDLTEAEGKGIFSDELLEMVEQEAKKILLPGGGRR